MTTGQRVLDIDGSGIFVDVRGDAANPPLLYIHGGPGMSCWDFMHGQGDRLAEQLYLVGVDQRGVLRSDPHPPGAAIDRQRLIDDFEAIRTRLQIPQWSILGHSIGGAYALDYARQHPATVTSVVFECPVFDLDASDRYRLIFASEIYDELGNTAAARKCRDASVCPQPLTLETGFFALRAGLGERLTELNWHQKEAAHRFAADRAASEFSTADWERSLCHLPLAQELYQRSLLDMLPGLEQAAILLHGRRDLVTTFEQIQAFFDSDAGPVVTFEESGHFPQLEEPVAYADAVTGFVSAQHN